MSALASIARIFLGREAQLWTGTQTNQNKLTHLAQSQHRFRAAVTSPTGDERSPPKILAFVLPQFHRIEENDRWWGEGFTEWTNVRRARPVVPGHYQPRVPAGKRYYDLTDPGVLEWQANLARSYGLHGFCYY
ncbi:MAG TPA: glycoside hydrolase family 99-like domain-containing protein, partial [Burkholderiaceae bacterium]